MDLLRELLAFLDLPFTASVLVPEAGLVCGVVCSAVADTWQAAQGRGRDALARALDIDAPAAEPVLLTCVHLALHATSSR